MIQKVNSGNSVFVLASAFNEYGGWSLDTQFILNMGMPYLLAHGLGVPVADASTAITFPTHGTYQVWVYTKNWVAYWKPAYAPGKYKLSVGDYTETFGDGEADWHWQRGGTVSISALEQTLTLHDCTGFEGRCGAVFFTTEADFVPPVECAALTALRRTLCGQEATADGGAFDFVVIGGGIAGICCAVEAARNGLKTALVHDRFVPGGNNSSEVRVWLSGHTKFDAFPAIGRLTEEFEQSVRNIFGVGNQAENYEDARKLAILRQEKNLTLYFGYALVQAHTKNGILQTAEVMDTVGGAHTRLRAPLFCDCSGDGTLGYLAGAEYELTAEGHMEQSNFWYVEDTGSPQTFPRCPWAIDLSVPHFPDRLRGSTDPDQMKITVRDLGSWFWGSGFEHDPIEKAEYARDVNFRAMYGAWDAIKNTDGDLPQYKIGFCSYITGKRESRRLLGDVILTVSDICSSYSFRDGFVGIYPRFDVHVPDNRYYAAYHEGDAFIGKCWHPEVTTNAFYIPLRSLYSRNIKNLFMAGRCLSCTHEALGMLRLMRTCGMMGEVVGKAAALCKAHSVLPGALYEHTSALEELTALCQSRT